MSISHGLCQTKWPFDTDVMPIHTSRSYRYQEDQKLMPRMRGMVSMIIMVQLSEGTKLNRTRGQEKGVVSVKLKNFIHGFKFMLKVNWMWYITLDFKAKVRN